MLSLELEEKLLTENYTSIPWYELKQKYLPNNKEEATLFFHKVKNKKGEYVGSSITIIYNGTDEDFIKQYELYMNSWDRKTFIKDIMEKYNMHEWGASYLADELKDAIWEYGIEVNLN